jgi:transposase
MRKIREILRLRFEGGLSHEKIAISTGISDSTVGKCLSRAKEAGLTWPLPDEMDDYALEELLYRHKSSNQENVESLPDYSLIYAEMKKKSVTLQLLWSEYKEIHPNGLEYSQFCKRYNEFKKTVDYSFRHNYKAGEKLFVDYAGQKVAIQNPFDGSIRYAQIFVAVLGASNYTYAEATWSQELPNWIASHQRAFQFFNGVPEIIVPDNLKSAVKRSCRYDPDINPAYYALAKHYQSAIIPARVRKPKDKAKAETGVLIVERWILAVLRKRKFFSLEELNHAIAILLEKLNTRPFRKLKGCRKELYEKVDRPALKPLPATLFEFFNFKLAKVAINYHVEVDGHQYSVPFQYVQKEVEIRFSETIIEVFYKSERITSHPRSFQRGSYSTNKDHMPPSHQKYVSWTPERMIRWAAETGADAALVAEKILASKAHPEQGFKSVLGLIRLGEKYGKDRLNIACRHAIKIGSPKYQTIQSILVRNIDKTLKDSENSAEKELPNHDNIRGASYYH